MQVNFLSPVQSLAFKPSAALLCALLLAGCNAKVIEPMRLVAAPSTATERMASDMTEPRAVSYGVPEASNVSFSPSAHEQVVDLTY
jgi:hypothetical protein